MQYRTKKMLVLSGAVAIMVYAMAALGVFKDLGSGGVIPLALFFFFIALVLVIRYFLGIKIAQAALIRGSGYGGWVVCSLIFGPLIVWFVYLLFVHWRSPENVQEPQSMTIPEDWENQDQPPMVVPAKQQLKDTFEAWQNGGKEGLRSLLEERQAGDTMPEDTKQDDASMMTEKPLANPIHEQLRNLKRSSREGVRFVEMSGLGAITVHSTPQLQDDPDTAQENFEVEMERRRRRSLGLPPESKGQSRQI